MQTYKNSSGDTYNLQDFSDEILNNTNFCETYIFNKSPINQSDTECIPYHESLDEKYWRIMCMIDPEMIPQI